MRTMPLSPLVAAFVSLFPCVFVLSAEPGPVRPNIVVFIIADDLGWADIGFHGGKAPTPHLDKLAAEGLELTRHYVAPVCSPTRTALLTGRCWSRFGVTSPQNERALPWDTVTLPSALKTAGYQTWIVGKWHLGSLPEQGPRQFGFDRSYGSLAGGVSPWNHRYKKGPFTRTWHRDDALIEEPGHVTDLIATEAVERLHKRDTHRPFLLYVPFTAVHLPVKEPREWVERVPADIEGEVERHYAASVMHLDDAVGRILGAIDALHLRQDTLIVFTSDNGGSWAENNDLSYPDDDCPNGRLPGDNRPWRGQKGQLYEGGIRVPTVVSWRGYAKPGKIDAPVQVIDWMPTFCALAGARISNVPKWDGADLSALLTKHESPAKRPIYSVAPGRRSRSLHFGDSKLIVFEDKGTVLRTELYDLAKDPAEAKNLAVEDADTAARLKTLLDAAARPDGDSVATDKKPSASR